MATASTSAFAPPQPRIAKSKSGSEPLFGKLKVYEHQDEQAAVEFLNQMLDLSIKKDSLHQELKDGVLLCTLVNKIRPGTIKHVGQRDLSFIKMDNITRFLQGARQLGLTDAQLFDTIDLFEAKNMAAVIHTILVIAQMVTGKSDNKEEDKQEQEHQNQQREKKEDVQSRETDDRATSYRDVRDIFTDLGSQTDAFVRPPKSPLRPASKPHQSRQQHQQKHHQQHHRRRYRRKSAEDLQHRRQPLEEPAFASHSRARKVPINNSSDFTLSRSSSTSSCSSYLSSASSSSFSSPDTPNAPLSPSSKDRTRRQSSVEKRQDFDADNLGKNLDRQFFKSLDGFRNEETREKLLLKSKDGTTRVQYQIGNCIGKGQFGSVYRALDLSTGEIVAVKRIKFEDAELDQEIMKEVGLLKTLSHPNVIQYLGFIRSKHHMNIVLEYAENGSLMSTLKAFGAFPEKLVASFCIKILNGLAYLHANQVVHCDLKAANILTTKTGDVKLSDFGVSLNLKIKGADAGQVSGTPNWMAPEVIELKGASTKSDIWSLGCTLIELITGKPPYADLIAMSAMFRIVEDNYPPLPSSISEDMRNFLMQCFQKNPDDRPTANELLEHPWIRTHRQRLKKNETQSGGLSISLDQQKRAAAAAMRRSTASSNHRVSSSSSPSSPATEAVHPLDRSAHNLVRSSSRQAKTSSILSVDDYQLNDSDISSGITLDEDYVTHRFIQTSFGKVVECKVCGELLKSHLVTFCEVCALICHDECKKLAFSCPPKVKDQQPSYDWVFSAKIYNRSRQDRQECKSVPEIALARQKFSLDNHPHAENIRKYSLALGLTPQEQRALSENQALLSHTLALQHMHPDAVEKLINKRKDRKKNQGTDDCTIS